MELKIVKSTRKGSVRRCCISPKSYDELCISKIEGPGILPSHRFTPPAMTKLCDGASTHFLTQVCLGCLDTRWCPHLLFFCYQPLSWCVRTQRPEKMIMKTTLVANGSAWLIQWAAQICYNKDIRHTTPLPKRTARTQSIRMCVQFLQNQKRQFSKQGV